MKLRAPEKAAILSGAREIRRPVRTTNRGGVQKIGVKRGQVHTFTDSKCLHIQRVHRDGSDWVIRFDVLDAWAMPDKKPTTVSIRALEELLPPVLSWSEEPDVRVGDVFVFDWHKIRDANEVQSISADEPKTYIEITSVGRGKRGEHIARYRKCGFDEDDFMAYGHGHTRNPRRAISDPESNLPEVLAEVDIDPEQQERDEVIRAIKRREASPTKREQLVLEREAHRRRLKRTNSEISRRVLPGLIERLDAQIEAIDESTSRRAA